MSIDPGVIRQNLEHLRLDIDRWAAEFGRNPADISVLAVSKTKPAELVRAALDAGQVAFGENYLQDAVDKVRELAGSGAEWHFIGAIQSNKTRDIAELFDWVQTVDRSKLVRRLDSHRDPVRGPLNICLQVNVDDEPQKAGARPGELHELAREVEDAPNLRLRGIMAIPRASDSFEQQCDSFRRVRECYEQLKSKHPGLDTLSMGMSADIRAAIAEGSSMLRVGTAIFGPRAPQAE